MKKLILIDGNSLMYRAYYATAYTGNLMQNSKGVYTNAIFGFVNMMSNIISNEDFTHILVAFDKGKTTFRHEVYPEYKGGRKPTPDELRSQVPLVKEYLDVLNIKRSEIEYIEADDIIGTCAKLAEKDNFDEIKVISGDKDLLQLVSDKTTVLITKKGITDVDEYTPSFLFEKMELTPSQITDLKGFMGDSSDNIPGVSGVGPKTALRLLKEYQTVENVIENVEQLKGKLKERIENNKEQAIKCKQLATIKTDVEIGFNMNDIKYESYEVDKLIAFYKELDFHSFIKKLNKNVKREIDLSYEVIDDITKLDKILIDNSVVIPEIYEHNYHDSNVLGFAIVNKKGNFYVSFDTFSLSLNMQMWLEDANIRKFTYDYKRSKVALKWKGYEFDGVKFDLLLGAYVINPALTNNDFRVVVSNFDYNEVPYEEEVYGKGSKRNIPSDDLVAKYVVAKAKACEILQETINSKLEENKQSELLYDVEIPLTSVLAEMEYDGIKVSKETLDEMGDSLSKRIQDIESSIYEIVGHDFNIGSPKQLGVVLFEELELPIIKKTKTGYSTNADVLEKLYDKHPIIEKILEYRQLTKLYSTYIDGLIQVIFKDGKVHTIFNQALTSTGRLSSVEPNLQNIPIRFEDGRKIRKAFVPSTSDGYIFAADYSQIELRVLAHISQTESLKKAFIDGLDIHTKTAMDVYDVEKDDVTQLMRRQAKAVNFGIVYGISAFGLSENINITQREAQAFIDKYLDSYPGVRKYMVEVVEDAKKHEYVETIMNRRRYIPELKSKIYNVRQFGERTAMNAPIQGSAADIIKIAMIKVNEFLKKEKLKTKLLIQVHDELVFDVPKDEIDIIIKEIPKIMEEAYLIDVPLKADFSYGESWYEAK